MAVGARRGSRSRSFQPAGFIKELLAMWNPFGELGLRGINLVTRQKDATLTEAALPTALAFGSIDPPVLFWGESMLGGEKRRSKSRAV